mgnify:FL=1
MKIRGNSGTVKVGNLVLPTRSWAVERSIEVIDVTTQGADITARQFVSNKLSDSRVNCEIIVDSDIDISGIETGDSVTLTLTNDYQTIGVSAIVSAIGRSAEVGELIGVTMDFTTTGEMSEVFKPLDVALTGAEESGSDYELTFEFEPPYEYDGNSGIYVYYRTVNKTTGVKGYLVAGNNMPVEYPTIEVDMTISASTMDTNNLDVFIMHIKGSYTCKSDIITVTKEDINALLG